DGLWLAFVTASTLGYGDLIPSTHASRVFSVFVVLLGFGVLSFVTAAIAATFVESQERRMEREILHDLHRQVKALHTELESLREEMRRR
ncbi:MAG TPA: potassium channel family protein, partial [Piscinibacter sp.]|nr:potassium channel family protein [Piscinibacter sp.]